MTEEPSTKSRATPPALELSGWILILGLGCWEVFRSTTHLGGFSAWLQIAVSVMGIAASLWRWRTGDR